MPGGAVAAGGYGGSPLYRPYFPGGLVFPRLHQRAVRRIIAPTVAGGKATAVTEVHKELYGLAGYDGDAAPHFFEVESFEVDRYPYTSATNPIAVAASDSANGNAVNDLIPIAGKHYFVVPMAVPIDVIGAVEAVSQLAGGIGNTAIGTNRRAIGSVAGGAAAGATIFRESLELQVNYPAKLSTRWSVDAGAAGASGAIGTFGWVDWLLSPPELPSGAFMFVIADDANNGDFLVKLTNPTGNVPAVSLPGYCEFLVGRALITDLGKTPPAVDFDIPIFAERAPIATMAQPRPLQRAELTGG